MLEVNPAERKNSGDVYEHIIKQQTLPIRESFEKKDLNENENG